jgi:hypothetical protein
MSTVARSVQCTSEPCASGLRLQYQADLRDTGFSICAAQTFGSQRIICELAREAHRPSHHDGSDRWQISQQAAQEAADQTFQCEGMAEDPGLGEAALRKIGLHRHDKPAVQRIFQIVGDRRWTGRVMQDAPGARFLGPEAQNGPEHIQRCVASCCYVAVLVEQRNDAVCRAKIHAKGADHSTRSQRARVQPRSAQLGKRNHDWGTRAVPRPFGGLTAAGWCVRGR